jgi:replicative DNA helicase
MSADNLRPDHLILSRMMTDAAAARAVAEAVGPSDFPDARERALFKVMVLALAAGVCGAVEPVLRWIDAHAPKMRAAAMDIIARGCDELYLAPIDAELSSFRAWSQRARLSKALAELKQELDVGNLTTELAARDVEAVITSLCLGTALGRRFDDKGVMADRIFEHLRGDTPPGLPYGYRPLDQGALPLVPGNLCLLGGGPGAGKSTIERNLIRQWCGRYGKRVGLLTAEMTGDAVIEAIACADLAIPVEQYYRRQLDESQMDALTERVCELRDNDLLLINELSSATPEVVLRIFRRWREQGVEVFVLDHLHRLDYGSMRDSGDLRLPIANMARLLKSFAADFSCVVMSLVQLTKRPLSEVPDDSRIRESQNIVEEADAAFFVYRPEVASQRDVHGRLRPILNQFGQPYLADDPDLPKGAIMAQDGEHVYLRIGKQRRRIRAHDATIVIPFNSATWAMYDSPRLFHAVA